MMNDVANRTSKKQTRNPMPPDANRRSPDASQDMEKPRGDGLPNGCGARDHVQGKNSSAPARRTGEY